MANAVCKATIRKGLATLAIFGLVMLTGTSRSGILPLTSIAQVPLTVAVPAHPQIVVAIGNSESMDGNLSGAIMAGSGSLNPTYSLLQNSSSPANFTIPAGFTPPVNPGAGGYAPYTVSAGGWLVDNSPSRLNVAKASVSAMLTTFLPNADFALIDYQTAGVNLYTTWLYEMSPAGSGFVFTNAQLPSNRYATNPCYQYTSLLPFNTIFQNCLAIDASGQVTGSMATSKYMQISASSDDPLINDVLYAGGVAPICVAYGGPSPANPYPPYYSLAQYNANPGNIHESYSAQINTCATTTTPTNAGYVPYTPQTMYIQRGFGYGGGQSATAANVMVPMTTAGQYPTTATVTAAAAVFAPFLQPETSSTATPEIKASAGQSALPGLLQGANHYFTASNPASSNGCTPTRYVILLTDGLPTLDLSGRSWPPPGTTSGLNYGMTPTTTSGSFNPDGSLNVGATNDQALIDTVNQLAALNSAGIETYVVGLGAGVDPTTNPVAAQVLTAMAVAGGTGTYFAATSPAALTNQLQVILAKILATSQSTAATAVNTTSLRNGSVAYLGEFTTSDNYQDWTGDLGAYPINPTTGVVNTAYAAANWHAKVQLDAQGYDLGRTIATWDPVAHTGIPFRWQATPALTGITPTSLLGLELSTFASDPSGQDVLSFLRGNNAQELRNGGQFRNRTHKLGDIVASAPLYVGKPTGFTQSSGYFSFAVANKNRSPVVYIGANDGMLHAIDAATGNERFAYIPNGVFANLVKLVNPYYNQNHIFYVNGSPEAADVQFSDGTWHTELAGTEGAGGQTVFALDVTAPDSITSEAALSSAVLWEFSDLNMGYSFSEPAFSNTSGGWMVFFGNGYNSPTQQPFLYAVDPKTGATKAKVNLCLYVPTACNPLLANGLSSVTVINSSGQVSAASDLVYAGDLQGNMWRVDISNTNPLLWSVKVIFQARDSLGNVQPITTAPAVALNPRFPSLLGTFVVFGTGQLLGFPDLTTTGVQSLYGVYDAPTGAGTPVGFAGIPTRGNLVQQTLSTASVGGVSVRIENSASTVTLPSQRGWYIDYSLAAGERIVTNPQIESAGAVVVTSYQPSTSSCVGGGNSWATVVNYATGGSFALPELDINGDGKLNSSDTASGKNPVGMFLGNVYASQATIISSTSPSSASQTPTQKLFSESNKTVDPVGERGTGRARTAWWEVKH